MQFLCGNRCMYVCLSLFGLCSPSQDADRDQSLGNSILGNSILGNSILGNSSLGNSSLGNSSLGNSTLTFANTKILPKSVENILVQERKFWGGYNDSVPGPSPPTPY
jgi:hypothetical protein